MALVNFLTIVLTLFWLAVVVLFLIVAWRAMRAHESMARSQSTIASDIHKIANSMSRDATPPLKPGTLNEVDPKSFPKFSD